MVDRWTVERAVRSKECTLDPPGRQLVLTLLTWTDHATATIPERFTPSLTDLVNGTGLARSTVAAWLNKLEKEGWVVRTRPSVADARSKKARTVYRLTVPSGPLTGLVGDEMRPPPGPDEREETRRAGPRGGPAASDSPRLAGPGDGPEMAGSSPGRGLELVRLADVLVRHADSIQTGNRTYRLAAARSPTTGMSRGRTTTAPSLDAGDRPRCTAATWRSYGNTEGE